MENFQKLLKLLFIEINCYGNHEIRLRTLGKLWAVKLIKSLRVSKLQN